MDLVKKHEYFTALKLEFPNLPDDLVDLCVEAFLKKPKMFIDMHRKELKAGAATTKTSRLSSHAGVSSTKLDELNARFLEEQAQVENKAWIQPAGDPENSVREE